MTEYQFLWKLKAKLRKWTTPIHILCGVVIAFAAHYCPPLAIVLFIGIGADEYWEWRIKGENDDSQKDFWEVLAAIFGAGAVVVLLLSLNLIS